MPPAGGRNNLRDRSPIHGFRDFQELYQAKPGTALVAALWIALLIKFCTMVTQVLDLAGHSKAVYVDWYERHAHCT